jgi:sulfur carrier protein ThiS
VIVVSGARTPDDRPPPEPFHNRSQSLTLFQGDNRMKCMYLNNEGAGFADHVEVEPGTTVAQFFAQRLPGRQAGDFLLRVNRQPCAADQVLQEGDRISITPAKIAGAA